VTPAQASADARSLAKIIAGGNFAAPLKECREVVRGDIKGSFDSESAPDGGAWPKRKPWPGDDGHPLLNDTGFLKAAALGQGPGSFEDLDGRSMSIGIDTSVDEGGIPFADIHDRGSSRMPERHFYAATEAGLDKCGEIIGDAGLEKLLAGSGG
jgi:hypothetical protein